MTPAQTESTTARRIDLVPLDSLVMDPRNPKSHALGDIDDSYDRFGVVDLITVDGRTGFILSGHGRATVLRQKKVAGDDPPEGITIDAATGEWLVPVAAGWSSRNDAEAAAALISMNRLTELGGWADEALLDLLDEISNSGVGFEGVGFSETDQDDLRSQLAALGDHDDDAPANLAGGGGAKAVSIKLQDPGLIDWWHNIRDEFKTDDEAVRDIASKLGDDIEDHTPVKAPRAKRKTSKAAASRATVADPTLADLGEDEHLPQDIDDPAVQATMAAEKVMNNVHNVVETDESGDPIIDWDNLPDGTDEDD